MSYLPSSKFGSCAQCGAKSVPCVKIGKVLICCVCNRNNKNGVQISKAKARDAEREEKIRGMKPKEKRSLRSGIASKVRGLIDTEVNKEMLPKPIGGGSELDRWFKERRLEMTGKCANCNGISCKSSEKYYKFSIAHLLPKKIFKSVATHPDNWIELCFWDNSCHSQMDNKMLDLIDMNCFDLIITKFARIYPHIEAGERRHIPYILLQYLEV